ncbi:MAG: DNA adenine methylase [Phenylobacterium sp.]|nr:DNA adenine methylase [Phenylobacterium sp.]
MPKNGAVEALAAGTEWFGDDHSSFVFRSIHYLGSKLRVLSAIEQAIDRVDPSGGAVCDLFSGSATVSRYLSRRRRVMAVDIQEYARVLAEAVLNGDPAWSMATILEEIRNHRRKAALSGALLPLISLENAAARDAMRGHIEPLCELLELGNLASLTGDKAPSGGRLSDAVREAQAGIEALGLPGVETVCIRHFGGQYFSYAQAADLDALAQVARELGSPVLLAATLSTASHLVNSIGKQFAQPIRPRDKSGVPKFHVVKKIIAERGLSAHSVFMDYLRQYQGLVVSRRDHVAVRADFREALAKPAFKPSVIYADPPYTRDHYSRFYHSLETIALGSGPIDVMCSI